MDSDSISLQHLVEEFDVGIRLNQYDVVSRLCSKIAKYLIKSLDATAETDNNNSDEEEIESQYDDEKLIDEEISQLVGRICSRLRYLGEIAQNYHEVCRFVRLQVSSASECKYYYHKFKLKLTISYDFVILMDYDVQRI